MASNEKAVMSVSEMAAAVGLSRARFYQLLGTTFPYPVYSVATRRPFFNEELQRVCLEVRKRNCGIDGKPLLFYSSRATPKPTKRQTKPVPSTNCYTDLVAAMKGLGLLTTPNQVEAAVKELFPGGVQSTDHGRIVREVFLFLKRQDATDSVGR